MAKQKHDIQLIQKYLNGELDAKAMHQLERAAQSDPFLMDALEGYGLAGVNQQGNLDMLSQQLSERVNKKERRIIPWTTLSIAATVLGFLVVVGLLYKQNQPEKPTPQTANLERLKKPPVIADTIGAPVIRDKEAMIAATPQKKSFISPASPATQNEVEKEAVQPTAMLREIPIANDSSTLDDKVIDYMAQQTPDTVSMPKTVAIKKPVYSQALPSKAKGVYAPSIGTPKDNTPVIVNGVNINKSLPATQSPDNNYGYSPPDAAAKGNSSANAAAIGLRDKYAVKKIRPDSSNLDMAATVSSLNEVVITRADVTQAHPKNGWIAFNTYLQKNSILPVGAKTGTVQLKFTVNPNGALSNIKVVTSLSTLADGQAVSLIRNGPAWEGNANGKAAVVKVSVKFEN